MQIKLIAIIALLALQGCASLEGEWFPSAEQVTEAEDSSENEATGMPEQVEAEPQEQAQDPKPSEAAESSVAMNNDVVESSPMQQQLARNAQQARAVTRANASNQQKIRMSVKNDYRVFQEINHQFIKSNQTPVKYKQLETTLSHFVMDLIANMSPDNFKAPLVVRPMKLKVGGVANAEAGKDLLTSLIAKQMKEYGFMVFDGRKPKGKFTGEELLLETVVNQHGEQFVLSGTLKQLSSNKIAGTNQAFITDYFFRNIKDGVEVYEHKSEFSTGGD